MKINFVYISLIVILLLVSSCVNDTPQPEQLYDEDGNEMLMEPAESKTGKPIPAGTIDVADLKGKKGHNGTKTFLDKDNNPYTGKAIQHSKGDSDAYIEYTITEGKMTRLRGFYENGQVERDFPFKDGISHGKFTMWFENGEKYIEEDYVNGSLSGNAKRWYEDGTKARVATFKNGKLVNETLYGLDGTIKK